MIQLTPGSKPLAIPLAGLGAGTRVWLSTDAAALPDANEVGCKVRVAIGSPTIGWVGIVASGNDCVVENGTSWLVLPLTVRPGSSIMSILNIDPHLTLTVAFQAA